MSEIRGSYSDDYKSKASEILHELFHMLSKYRLLATRCRERGFGAALFPLCQSAQSSM